jgi:hypothetical protein
METRRKSRKSDPKRGDRPYIGYRKDGKQQRFSLGAIRRCRTFWKKAFENSALLG